MGNNLNGNGTFPSPRTIWGVNETTPALEALNGSDLACDVVRTERATSAEESALFQGIELGELLRTIVIRRGENDL